MLTVKAFHGTTKQFKNMAVRRTWGVGGYAGAGLYFTDNVRDAVKNYALPTSTDLRAKIDFQVERLENLHDTYTRTRTFRRRIEKQMIQTNRLITAEVSFKRPFIIGGEIQYIGGNYRRYPIFKRITEYVESLCGNCNYSSEPEENFIDEFRMMMYEGTNTDRLWNYCISQYIQDDNLGLSISGEFARKIVSLLGYDGVVQENTIRQWPYLMNSVGNSTHYIAFHRRQVKIISDAILLN